MDTILLISMPFANLTTPSLALAQIQSVTRARVSPDAKVELAHLTHDFGQLFGLDDYNFVSNSMQALYAGLGDWLFRHIAFPDLPDNTERYMQRFFRGSGGDIERVKRLVGEKRPTIDAFLDELIERHGLDRARIIGFTSMFMQNVPSFALARKLKQRNAQLTTVMGGANCEFPMGRIIARRVPQIDYVFSGPALVGFPEFVERRLTGQPISIPGVLSREHEATVEASQSLGKELNIDVPIAVEFDEFLDRYHELFPTAPLKPIVPIETSRGCWWGQRAHCTFCGLNGASMAYRAMRPDLAIKQFATAFRYSDRASSIEAVDNILPKSYLTDVLPFIETPETMDLFYEVKADLTRREMAVLAQARVKRIQPGIEALATSTLKLMKKGTTACQNVTFLRNCGTFGLHPYWNLLVGFPGEREDVYRRYTEILSRLTHLTPPLGVFPIRFDRFSPYHKDPASYGLDLHPMDFYSSVYPFSEAELGEFAYYFSDRNWNAEHVQAVGKWIRELWAHIGRWQARWTGPSFRGSPPRLQFKDDGVLIYDSREGAATERDLGPLGKTMLTLASNPIRVDELLRVCARETGADATNTLAAADAAGLIFQEGDRVVSLVFASDADEAAAQQMERMAAPQAARTDEPVVPLQLISLGRPASV